MRLLYMLGIANLNPDTDNNGTRDGGPFGLSSTDGVPYTGGTLLRLEQTKRTDYFSSTSTTNVSASNLTFTNSLAAHRSRSRLHWHGQDHRLRQQDSVGVP